VEEGDKEVDTRERGERKDTQPRPIRRRPTSGAGFSSFLSGLLGSVTKTASVDACPGKCIHALASLMCDTVLEEVQCPTDNMRCCVEKSGSGSSRPTSSSSSSSSSSLGGLDLEMPPRPTEKPARGDDDDEEETEKEEEVTEKPHKRKKNRRKNRTTTTPATTTTSTTTTDPTTRSTDEEDDEDSESDSSSSGSGPKSCPGVCVADRISCFCEAILDISSLCGKNLRCCVAKKIFSEEKTPKALIFPKEDGRCKTGGGSKKDKKKDEDEDDEEIMDTAETTTQLDVERRKEERRRKEQEKKEKKEKERREKERREKEKEKERLDEKKRQEEKNSPPVTIPPERRCRGTCVTGFFSLLCDEIDRSAQCPGPGRCCITRAPPPPPPRRPTARPPPIRRVTRPPPPPKPIKSMKCPGVCIPDVMLSLCSPPSVIVPILEGCSKGTFCCDHQGQSPQRNDPPRPPPPRPQPPKIQQSPPSRPSSSRPDMMNILMNAAPSILGALTGEKSQAEAFLTLLPILTPLLNGGGGNSAPPPPQPQRIQVTRAPPTPATTTTTTTTTEKSDPRPECLGTCIAPYLSFTCFGNAETSDLFSCSKRKTICCSTKAQVKEELMRKEDRKRIDKPFPGFGVQQRHPDFSRDPALYHPNQEAPHRDQDTTVSVSPVSKYECGVKGRGGRTGRVVGGEDASPGEWCWQVALINSLNQYLCGGALIGQSWVLTAAHCVTNIVRAGDAIYVRVGDHDLTQKFGSPGAQTLRVATTYIHHNHNSQTLDNDIALLKLHGDAELKEGVCLVCLPARGTSQATGKKCTVTGYGYMGETGPIPLRVREARVPIVNDNECVRKINTVTEKIFILPASSFCAGGIQGHDACQGDGGGPLVCEDSGYHELTGLVSWGFGCGRKDVPGVYVKVSSFIGWINQIISVNNS